MATPTHVSRFAMTSEADQLVRMRAWLWNELVGQALPLEACSAMLVAVGEICNNAIKHAYGARPGEPIAITLGGFPDRVVVEVEDEGIPFDPHAYKPPDLDAVPERGMGLFLVRKTVDDLMFDTDRPRGTRWTLVKYRPRPADSPPG
jgi:anti-sigma regulatory factor (Ser/Thr protein kinase)